MVAEFRDGSREGDQAPPTPNDRPIVQELVIQDIKDRLDLGVRRYGTGLQAFNGRDMLKDAYDEALDLATYLRGLREEVAELQARNSRLTRLYLAVVNHADMKDEDAGGGDEQDRILWEVMKSVTELVVVGEKPHRPVERLADLEAGDQV